MRLHRPRIRTLVMVLGTSGLLGVVWHFWPQVYDTVRQADRLTVYEGHARFEGPIEKITAYTSGPFMSPVIGPPE